MVVVPWCCQDIRAWQRTGEGATRGGGVNSQLELSSVLSILYLTWQHVLSVCVYRQHRSPAAAAAASAPAAAAAAAQMYKDDGLSRGDIESLVATFSNQALDFFGALRAATYDTQIRDWMASVAGEVEAAAQHSKHSTQQPSIGLHITSHHSGQGCRSVNMFSLTSQCAIRHQCQDSMLLRCVFACYQAADCAATGSMQLPAQHQPNPASNPCCRCLLLPLTPYRSLQVPRCMLLTRPV